MKQYMVDLQQIDRFCDARRGLGWSNRGSSLQLLTDSGEPGVVFVANAEGARFGILPRKGKACADALAGRRVGELSWQSFGDDDVGGCPSSLRVRLVFIDEGEIYDIAPEKPTRLTREPPTIDDAWSWERVGKAGLLWSDQAEAEEEDARSYNVGIVGEANHQDTIRALEVGQGVAVFHEVGNPFDPWALVVCNYALNPIGYIAKDSWVQRAVHDEGQGCFAVVADLAEAEGTSNVGVVLSLWVAEVPLPLIAYRSRVPAPPVSKVALQKRPTSPSQSKPESQPSPAPLPRKGWFARLFGN